MIKVSIIVPFYNVENYIEKCLQSLVNQTLEDIEILLVNDGSQDTSEAIAKQFVEKYPNKIIYLEKENGGLSDARNYAIPYAKGEYIAFLDSDDYVETNISRCAPPPERQCAYQPVPAGMPSGFPPCRLRSQRHLQLHHCAAHPFFSDCMSCSRLIP